MPVEILLIEDNAADVRIIKEIVSHSTVVVTLTVAGDGEEAVALLGDSLYKPDLIITDANVPKISLPEVLRLCNAESIPVVVFSAAINPAEKAEVLSLGAKEFVEKPVHLDAYIEAVWRMIWKWVKPTD